jgi:PAS domain S-box-containing protein
MTQVYHPDAMCVPRAEEEVSVVKDELEAQLEARVEERTAELRRANSDLTRELAEQRQVEEALRQSNAMFQRTEALLQRKSMFLQLLQEVTVAANEAVSLEKALQVCLERVCACTGWPIGHVYHFPEDSRGELTSTTLWHFRVRHRFEKFQQETQGVRFLPGSGLPGRVLLSGKPAWIKDVKEEPDFPRVAVAKQLGIGAALAFPVLTGKEVVAVLEFFATNTQEPDEALLEVMANIGTQLGRVIERTRAAEALRHSELRFRSVAESAFEAIISADAGGNVIYWNRGAQQIFGYTAEEVLGQPLALLMPERYRAAHGQGLERLRTTGAARVIGKTVEMYGLRKGGEEFPVELSLSTWKTAEGSFFTGIIRDITERKMAAEKLRASEERFRMLVAGVKDYAILMLDPQGLVLSWNAGAERIKGYGSHEIIGQHFSRFYPTEAVQRGWPDEELKRAAVEGRFEDEGWRVRKDGSRLWANVIITALRDDAGKLIGFAKVTRDLTERKRAEENVLQGNARLEAANKELEAFSYSVSHDLRAPLRAINGFSRIVLQEYAARLPDQARRYLELIRDNAKDMGQLIDDLLNFSRLSRQSLQKRCVASADLVRQALADLRSEQEGRSLEINLGDLPSCQADPSLLKQVFANLLNNALKYTRPREKAVIEVGCRGDGTDSGVPVFFVKDNGVGFDMRHVHKLFRVFQRLHRAEDYEGTGVGLAIVQRIVHRHGGRVWAEAKLNQGATFCFTLGSGTSHE